MKNLIILSSFLVITVLFPNLCDAQHCASNPKGMLVHYRKHPNGLTEVSRMTYKTMKGKIKTLQLGMNIRNLGLLTGMFIQLKPSCFVYAGSKYKGQRNCYHHAPIMGVNWATAADVDRLISYTTCSGKKVYFSFRYPKLKHPAPKKRRARPVRRRPSK